MVVIAIILVQVVVVCEIQNMLQLMKPVPWDLEPAENVVDC